MKNIKKVSTNIKNFTFFYTVNSFLFKISIKEYLSINENFEYVFYYA